MKKMLLLLVTVIMAVAMFGAAESEFLPFCTSGLERMPWLVDDTLYFVGTNYDIYYVNRVNGEWGSPEVIPGEVNTAANEVSPCVLKTDGKVIMYFSRYSEETDYDYYRAEYDPADGNWKNIKPVPELSTPTQDWKIWVNPEETVAYMATKGTYGTGVSFGGRDIWMSVKKDGLWTTPINVEAINTPSNEWSVFVEPSGKIWLDGARDESVGAYDIYCYDPATGKVVNPGDKLNSVTNERSMWTDGKTIIFSSDNRKGAPGGYDLFITDYDKVMQPEEEVEEPEVNSEAINETILGLRDYENEKYKLEDKKVTTEGVVLVNSGQWHDKATYFSISDGKRAVFVYAPGFLKQLNEGETVTVNGILTIAGYTSDINSLCILVDADEDIQVTADGAKLPDPAIIFTDTSKDHCLRFEGMPVIIFGKLSRYDNDSISRGFYVDGTSDMILDDSVGEMQVKFYSYADIDISDLANGDYVSVQGILVQDKNGNFYVRPTQKSDIKKINKNKNIFYSTLADKALTVEIAKPAEEKDVEFALPEGIELLTALKSIKGFPFADSFFGTSNSKKIFASFSKVEGKRNDEFPPAVYEIKSDKTYEKVHFTGEAEQPFVNGNMLVFAGRISPDDKESSWDIYSYNLETQIFKNITVSQTDEIEPLLSPDNAYLAYSRRNGGNWELVTIDMESGNEKFVLENARRGNWIANTLVFQTFNGNDWDIASYDLETSSVKPLIKTSYQETCPMWSPDGKRLSFISNMTGESKIMIMEMDTGEIYPALPEGTEAKAPFWISETEIGFAFNSEIGWNLARTVLKTPGDLPETSALNEAPIARPRLGAPSMVDINDNRLEIVPLEGYKVIRASIDKAEKNLLTLSPSSGNEYILPSLVEPGLYSLNLIMEKDGKFLEFNEPNSVFIGEKKEDFSFAHITDVHLGLSKAPANEMTLVKLLRAISDTNPDFLLITGDVSNAAQYYKEDYPKMRQTIIDNCDFPVFMVSGNHDSQRAGDSVGKEMWLKYFGPLYYSFNWGNWHFTGFNSGDSKYGIVNGEVSDEQFEWLKKDLANAGEKNLVIFGHHNPFDTRWNFYEADTDRERLASLFQNEGVRVGFFGHRHTDAIDYYEDIIAVTTAKGIDKEIYRFRTVEISGETIVRLNDSEPKSVNDNK